MKERLLGYLVCPDCKEEFKLSIKEIEGDEIMEGILACSNCSKEYFITGGVPRILKDDQGVNKLPLGKCLMSFNSLGFRQFKNTVFDKMIPPILNYYTEGEFRKWFANQNLADIQIMERNNNSWRGLGTSKTFGCSGGDGLKVPALSKQGQIP